MSSQTVDVMTPVFNGAPYVRAAIESILRQTHKEFRILVTDNGSTDGTPAILAELAARDSRIRLVTQEHTSLVVARNRQLGMASADLISFQDADDISEPDRLRKQVSYLAANPDCVGVSGAGRHIDAQGDPTGHVVRFRPPQDADPTWLPAREPTLLPFTVMRRRAVEAAGGFRQAFHADDTDLYWRLSRIGSLVNLPDILGSYRLHDGSDTGKSVLTSRIMAMTTQLSALSAARARRGAAEIAFDAIAYEAYRDALTMEGIFALAAGCLDGSDARHLRLKYASKALQLFELRRQSPDLGDCRFIRDAYGACPVGDPINRRELRRLITVIGARLLRSGRPREARSLVPWPYAAEALARATLKRA